MRKHLLEIHFDALVLGEITVAQECRCLQDSSYNSSPNSVVAAFHAINVQMELLLLVNTQPPLDVICTFHGESPKVYESYESACSTLRPVPERCSHALAHCEWPSEFRWLVRAFDDVDS